MGIAAPYFSYETMCDDPEQTAHRIRTLVPELDDLELRQQIRVKDYDEPLRNMNSQQIARLSQQDLDGINAVLDAYRAEMEFFGYERIESVADSS